MNLGWEPGNDKQNYVVCISISRDNGEITRKEMLKLFFQNYHYQYSMMKCCRNVDFEEMDTECSIGKGYEFWVLWAIFKEYIKQNIIVAVSKFAFSCHVQIDYKINNVKEDSWRKTDSNFSFSQAT